MSGFQFSFPVVLGVELLPFAWRLDEGRNQSSRLLELLQFRAGVECGYPPGSNCVPRLRSNRKEDPSSWFQMPEVALSSH